jgi:rSAM/selenodomain-associated transferase 2
MQRLSIVIPVLNEASGLPKILRQLTSLRQLGAEVIVVDGGSQDDSLKVATPLADRVIVTPRGRAVQMNAGAAVAGGDVLLFLHADTQLPADAYFAISTAIDAGRVWGRFDVRIEGRHWMLKVVGTLINLRSRLSGIATGDQAIFVRRDVFLSIGGIPALPLMEDLALCDCLLKRSRPACLGSKAVTSGRRWEAFGVWRTIFLMWRLRAAYRLGVSPESLARLYAAPRAKA